jgi:serine/threonine-protein kinase
MEDTLHIPISNGASVTFLPVGDFRGAAKLDVRQSATVQLEEELGKLGGGVVFNGRLFFTADRIHGLFTEAKTKDGTTYPVCLELVGCSTRWMQPGGVEREDVGGPADSAVIFSAQCVRAVRQFPN